MKNKQEYITIGLPKSTLTILKKFMEIKGLTSKEVYTEITEAYMMAKDEELFRKLQNDYYNIDGIIETMKKREEEMKKKIIREAIVCKLSDTKTTDLTGNREITGRETIEIYKNNIQNNGKNYTYYSTSNLHMGMSEKKRKEFISRIDSGDTVKIYFALNDDETNNDIAYSAKILDIISNREPIGAPCSVDEYPIEFRNERANVWIKISDIKEESNERAEDYIVTTKGTVLKQSISTGQCAFMYVKKLYNN